MQHLLSFDLHWPKYRALCGNLGFEENFRPKTMMPSPCLSPSHGKSRNHDRVSDQVYEKRLPQSNLQNISCLDIVLPIVWFEFLFCSILIELV